MGSYPRVLFFLYYRAILSSQYLILPEKYDTTPANLVDMRFSRIAKTGGIQYNDLTKK